MIMVLNPLFSLQKFVIIFPCKKLSTQDYDLCSLRWMLLLLFTSAFDIKSVTGLVGPFAQFPKVIANYNEISEPLTALL